MTTPISSTSSSSRPLRTLAALVLAMVALLAALNWFARWLEGPEHIAAGKAELVAVPGTEAVVLGPSVASQLYLPAMCLTGKSIPNSGQDLFETVALADHLIERGDIPPLVIVANAAEFHLSDNGSAGTARRTRRIETYRLLQSLGDWRMIDGDWAGAARAAVLPALGYDNWRARARQAWIRWKAGASQRGKVQRQRPTVFLTQEEDRREAQSWFAARSLETSRIGYRDSEVPERALRALMALSDRLQRHGSRLVVVNMPLSPAIRELLDSRPAADLRLQARFMDDLRSAGITVIDGTSEPGFADDIIFFRDPTHLNGFAAVNFSRHVAERLAARGYIAPPTCEKPEDIVRTVDLP